MGIFLNAWCLATGVKQGYVIAPILFMLFFAAMLDEAFANLDEWILIRFRTDGGIFSVRSFKPKLKFSYNLFVIFYLLITVASLHTH